MSNSVFSRSDRALGGLAVALALSFQAAPSAFALSSDGVRYVQGLFCNTEAQIDRAAARMRSGATAAVAAASINAGDVVCSFVDRLGFAIVAPARLGPHDGPLFKYRAMLVGVRVGDRVRPVMPPVPVYFLAPGPIDAEGQWRTSFRVQG